MSGVGMSATHPTTLAGTDGFVRCGWVTEVDTDLTEYHDREWGTPVHAEADLFQALVLTYFENGLSWAVVFNKREALRRAFADFEPAAVATMTDRDVDVLMKDHTIIRNRAKIEATVHNARLLTVDVAERDRLAIPTRPTASTAAVERRQGAEPRVRAARN